MEETNEAEQQSGLPVAVAQAYRLVRAAVVGETVNDEWWRRFQVSD